VFFGGKLITSTPGRSRVYTPKELKFLYLSVKNFLHLARMALDGEGVYTLEGVLPKYTLFSDGKG
jgi:hypothetical protein